MAIIPLKRGVSENPLLSTNDDCEGVKNNTVEGGCMSERWREEEETRTFAVRLQVVTITVTNI